MDAYRLYLLVFVQKTIIWFPQLCCDSSHPMCFETMIRSLSLDRAGPLATAAAASSSVLSCVRSHDGRTAQPGPSAAGAAGGSLHWGWRG